MGPLIAARKKLERTAVKTQGEDSGGTIIRTNDCCLETGLPRASGCPEGAARQGHTGQAVWRGAGASVRHALLALLAPGGSGPGHAPLGISTLVI